MSAEIVASNEDLLIIILSKLPTRSLLRFKSVSKQWQNLISSPRLAFLQFNPDAVSGFFINRTCYAFPDNMVGGRFISLRGDSLSAKPPLKSLLNISREVKILNSCNGFLLCGDSRFDSQDFVRRIYIYNPTLDWYKQVPSSEGMRRAIPYGYFHEHHWSLIFDPLKSSSYKVIYLHSSEYESSRCHYSIEIYSSETGLWKLFDNRIVLDQGMNLSINFSKGIGLNGVIYWPSFGCKSSLCFDVSKESVKTLSMPTNGLRKHCNSCFVESHGYLYYVEYRKSQCYVHQMDESCCEWFLKYIVDVNIVMAASSSVVREGNFRDNYAYSVLSFIRGMDESDALVFYIAGSAVHYDIEKMSCKKLCDLETSCVDDFSIRRFHGVQVYNHIETLLTLTD